ncbi:MAG: CoA pyrophosphatase [Acidobacteriota bacterium]
MLMEIIKQIHERLATLNPRELSNGYIREAAVLIPIFKINEEYHLLLTRRTETVETHKGQISFPGGMRESDEALLETALRETNEEVGIKSSSIETLGRFHDYLSITRFRVTPFVGFIHPPFKTKRQANEVAEILHVPFSVFLDPHNPRIRKQKYPGRELDVYFYPHGTHQIWGLTARIIKELFDTLDLAS